MRRRDWSMSLKEKLEQKQSTGENMNNPMNESSKIKEVEKKTELIAQRIDQLASVTEENNRSLSKHIINTSKMNEKNNQQLENKIENLKSSQKVLASSVNDAVHNNLQGLTDKMGKRFATRTDNITEGFEDRINHLDKLIEQEKEKQRKNIRIMEHMKFIFSHLVFVVVAFVLIRALFYGIWEGFNVEGLYTWGSQWQWLKYTMIGLYVVLLGTIAWTTIQFIRSNLKFYL